MDMEIDIQNKLMRIRVRQLVAEFCRRAGHGRFYFYKVLKGEASVLEELSLIDELLAASTPINPITVLREEVSVILNRVIDRAELARRLKISRQTVSLWESQADASPERLKKVQKVLLAIAVSINRADRLPH